MTKARDLADYTGLQGDLALKSPVASPVFTGNVGVGVTPETSSSGHTSLAVGGNQRFETNTVKDGGNYGSWMQNAHYEGSWKYISTGATSRMYQGAGTLAMQVAPSGSADAAISWNTAMTIDNAGRVTQPLQPVVFVTRQSTLSVGNDSANNPTTLDFDSAILNIGSHFNLSNDRFTAPVAGRYEISWSYPTNPDSATVYRTFIWKNGTKLAYTQLRVDSNGHTGYLMGSRTAILELAASDYFVIGASSDNSTNFYADGELRIVMTIRLIG